MKIQHLILILFLAAFCTVRAQTTNSFQAPPGSLEIVLNFQSTFEPQLNFVVEDPVMFNDATNITMRITFRNVGDVILDKMGLYILFTVIWDGKEYKGGLRGFDGPSDLDPKTAYRVDFPLSKCLIPKEALASGRHTIAVKAAGVQSNIQTIFIEPNWGPHFDPKSGRVLFY